MQIDMTQMDDVQLQREYERVRDIKLFYAKAMSKITTEQVRRDILKLEK
jgi:hypothetical protein